MNYSKSLIAAILCGILLLISNSTLGQTIDQVLEKDFFYLAIAIAAGSALSFWVTTIWGKRFYNSSVVFCLIRGIVPEVGLWTIFFGNIAQLAFNEGPYDSFDYFQVASNILTLYWFIIIPIALLFWLFARIITYILFSLFIAAGALHLLNSNGYVTLPTGDLTLELIKFDLIKNFGDIGSSNQLAITLAILLAMITVIIFRQTVIKLSVALLSGLCLVVTFSTLSYLFGKTEAIIPTSFDFSTQIPYFQHWVLIPFVVTLILQFFIIPDRKSNRPIGARERTERQEPTLNT